MSISALLDRKLTLQRPRIIPDASGGSTRTFVTLLSDVPASIAPASASISADYARRDTVVDHRVYITADLDTLIPGGVALGDRLVGGADVYLVKAVKKSANAMVSSEVLYQIDCERR